MHISMDIIKNELEEYVNSFAVYQDSGMALEECAFLEEGQSVFLHSRLYVCKDGADISSAPDGCCFVLFCGSKVPTDRKLNYIVLNNISMYKAVNLLLEIFRKYFCIEQRFEKMTAEKATIEEFVDYATEVVGMPLCLLDMNYRVIALSSAIDLSQDKLWVAMKHGYGLPYYDYIKECDIKIEELAKSRVSEKETWSNLAENYLRVSLVTAGNRPVASLGMHKRYEFRQPFEKYTIQLFDYVVEMLSQRAAAVGDIADSRGKASEQVLLDLLGGGKIDTDQLEQRVKSAGMPPERSLNIGVIFPKGECCRTERFLNYMEFIECMADNTYCCIYETRIVFAKFTNPRSDEKNVMPEAFADFLAYNNFYCVYSLELEDLTDIADAYNMLCGVSDIVSDFPVKPTVYCAENYIYEYAMTLLNKSCDVSKLLHPMVKAIMDYDRREHSNLYCILRAYLRNDCSLKQTSNALYMHRNTLAFKLDRIRTLTNIDFENSELRKQVLFSVECFETSKKPMKKR